MPLVAVEPRRLYRQIADQLAALIAAGEFPPGSRLPPERELADKLGVSRASVREAVICLELAGAVEVRIGTGIFVCAAHRPHGEGGELKAQAGDDSAGPFEILAARALIEGEIAALAARAIRAPALATLRETIERMRAQGDDAAERDAADRAFHLTIAEATGNGALVFSVATLWDLRRGSIWQATEQHFHSAALRAKTLADHAAIVGALGARDAEAARTAMRRHLARVAREFQRSIETRPGAQARAPAAKRAHAPGGRGVVSEIE
jgi:DNA-binding FadR family transcriptional regulator